MPVTAAQAARLLGVSAVTVRKWIHLGAPCVRLEQPMLVDVAALRRWRSTDDHNILELLGTALLDTLRRDCGRGQPAPEYVGVDRRDAAALYLFFFDRAVLALTGKASSGPLPASIEQLRRIAKS